MTTVASGAPSARNARNTRTARRPVASRGDRAPTATARSSSNALLLLATIAVLNVLGVVMVLSASSVSSITDYGSPWYFFLRQLIWTVAGVVAFVVAVRVDYRRWQRLVPALMTAAAGLLVVVLVPGVGIHVSGSRRWLGVDAIRFQPSELAKLALLLYAADIVSRRSAELADWRRVVKPVVLVLGAFAVLVMAEPDLGSTLVLALVVAAVLVAGGVKANHLACLGALGVTAVVVLALAEPYRRTRLLTFLHPFDHAGNAGYQVAQSFIALGSGGLTGVGLGASRAKWNFLPNAHTDFIFAIIGEELGLIGAVAVLSLFVALAVFGIRAALRAPDRFGALLAAGITAWIVGQAVINVGAVIGLLPVTGIPLPFVSFGGSALMVTMFASGILVNVARQSRSRAPR